jgi:general L-amino acid transport system permease protein
VVESVHDLDVIGSAPRPRRSINYGLWLSVLGRALVLLALAGVVYLMARHVSGALERQNISTGFGFLSRPARFQIGETLIAFSPADTYGRALLVALLNTLQVGIIGCILASILGLGVGIARLSGNPLLRRLSGAYIELFRNTPILLQLFFWYAVIQVLPPVRQSFQLLGSVFISQRGIQMPALSFADPYYLTLGLAVLVIAALFLFRRRAGHAGWLLIAAPLLLWGVAWLAGFVALSLETPELAGFGFRGGVNLSPEFLALLIGLVAYTAAFIAAIVRGGIEAIPAAQ